MLLSILIPTLERRRASFGPLVEQLQGQIRSSGRSGQVEILWSRDAGEKPIGTKRNELLRRARGDYVAFVDDDDRVAPDYVDRICRTLAASPDADCLGITGQISFRGRHTAHFVHSLRYREYRSVQGVYQRPPYHLNPVRRAIALRYPFAEVSYSEDIDWALRLCADGALRTEVFLPGVIYYYDCRRHWPYQWLLDRTEGFRHALGLTFANRLRFARRRGSTP
jgi:glycosyltransferase involved in cell wall biosynthesis